MSMLCLCNMCNRMHAKCQKQITEQDQIIKQLRAQLMAKNNEICELRSLLDKYQSVFTHQAPTSKSPDSKVIGFGSSDGVTSSSGTRQRGIGISAEPKNADQIQSKHLKSYPKPTNLQKLLRKAILENEFLNNLASTQLHELIDCMHPIEVNPGEPIINEGEFGSLVYVLSDGHLEVTKDRKRIRDLTNPTVFGELAILYNCKRTAGVKAVTKSKLWAIDRKSFQTILMQKSLQKYTDYISFLKSVPIFEKLPEVSLSKLSDRLTEVIYRPNEYIIRQGARGDNFYIIADGEVQVTIFPISSSGEIDQSKPAQFVRKMGRGDWFGEKALKGDTFRTANICATDQGSVTCLALDLESYNLFIRDLEGLERQYDTKETDTLKIAEYEPAFKNLKLNDVKSQCTLGAGGFGRVELVHIGADDKTLYALKKMKKHHIVSTNQQEHIVNERNIMLSMKSDFVVRLWRSFRDDKYIYLLLDICLGGELWSLLREFRHFTERATQFYVACVLEALSYLHSKRIVYRDLKPENIMLDTKGYCKITDFGFAKYIPHGSKTWTFCGTPEYMAPEIILNRGHDFAVDYWSFGVLIYELICGLPPFTSADAMQTYKIILRGIDAIQFPSRISKNAQNLIKKLCRDNPTERVGFSKDGITGLAKHVWFEGFDWNGLRSHTLPAPVERPITPPNFVAYFDFCPEDTEEVQDETSGWDAGF